MKTKPTTAAARMTAIKEDVCQNKSVSIAQLAEQAWKTIDIGHKVTFPTITGGIFEFGFSDSMLQMITSFVYELSEGKSLKTFAALESNQSNTVYSLKI